MFTDDSRDPDSGKAGFRVYVAQSGLGINKRIANETSVFTTELLAILWAWWTDNVTPIKILICSDSAAALTALKGGKSTAWPDFINNILFFLFRIGMTGCEVKCCWVPGHAGVEGNEIADSMSKETPKKK